VLDYWANFNDGYGAEAGDLFQEIPPNFGRLICFDGRLPHGVRRGPLTKEGLSEGVTTNERTNERTTNKIK
jgi:hypothetical protein